MRGTVLYGARDVRYEEVPELRTSGLIAVSMK